MLILASATPWELPVDRATSGVTNDASGGSGRYV